MKSVITLSPVQRAELFNAAAQRLGMGPVAIEKDFWVCWTLRELFAPPGMSDHLIFKGGTSLSKVWQAIQRFSEDIDISLSKEWLGFGQEQDPEHQPSQRKRKRQLQALAEACAERVSERLLPLLQSAAREQFEGGEWAIEVSPEDAQTLLFRYPTSFPALPGTEYIARTIKIECGARSDPWPAEHHPINPYVAEAFPDSVKDAETSVRALAVERTFWEKATILHAEAHRPSDQPTPGKYSRHYADLAALADLPGVHGWMSRDQLRERVVAHKQVFFASAWARYDLAVPGSFRLLPSAERLRQIEADYREMQVMYFGSAHPWSQIVQRLETLESAINRSTLPKS
jgi:hypothetical protein